MLSTEGFQGSENTLCIMMGICPYTCVQVCRMYTTKSEPQSELELLTLGDSDVSVQVRPW